MKLPRPALIALLPACFLGSGGVRADDLTTLSGTTYRGVVAVRVEPDGVTWQHATGVAKVDFADSPATVRQAYHYDAAKAAAYHAAQEQARAEAAGQTRQDEAARQRARVQAVAASGGVSADGSTFNYRRGAASEVTLAERMLGEQIDALKDKQAATLEGGNVDNHPFWHGVPKGKFGIGTDTSASAKAVNDYRSSPYHAPAEGTQHAWSDGAFQPNYLLKGYNDEVDRSAALLRNAGF